MSENEKSKDLNDEFANTTSMHGVYFLYTSRSKVIKAFWSILIIGMVLALISQVSSRIYDYFQYATSTDISEEFVTFLPFPAVTLCSFNRYFVENPNSQMLNSLYTLNQMTSPSYVAYSTHMNIKPNISKAAPLGDNINITKIADRLGFSIDRKYMPKCRFKSSDCNPDEFIAIFTSLGKCYTFNEGDNGTRIQNIPGAGHGLSVTLNIRHDLYTEEPFVGNSEAGLKIQVHSQYEAPDVETYGVSIPVGMKANIELSRKDFEIMYEPWGRCNPDKEILKYFSTYTLNNCVQECYTDAVIKKCGCRLFTQYWASNYSHQCTLEEMQNCASEYLITMQQNYSAKDCDCGIPCQYTKYDLTISYASYPNLPNIRALMMNIQKKSSQESKYFIAESGDSRLRCSTRPALYKHSSVLFLQELMNKDEIYVKGNAIQFEIYFKSMSYSTVSQSKKVDESSLLSDIGGQLGLWLGMSVVTAVELLGFILKKTSKSRSVNKVGEENPKT